MYIVTIQNNETPIEIHGDKQKLTKGSVVKGINVIDSFSFSLLPSNVGFSKLYDYRTLVSVYNTNKNRYDFCGRVLYSDTSMSESGLITKDVICESYLGFLCDSQQPYVEERNWTVNGLFGYIIDTHNSQVEDYKRFKLGNITVTDPNDLVYIGIQRANTWETIQKKLIKKLGGEITFRVEEDGLYLDYLVEIGEESTTEIALSKNMKSITQEKDPSEIVTRLIPLGYKITAYVEDEEGNEQAVETEKRLDITSVNDGKNYIDDEAAIALYGIRVGTVEFDDVTVASTLLLRGEQWLAENNKVRVKYTVGTLDLSLLGLDFDDFDVGNYYPIKNALIDIDTTVRVVKKTIDVCEEVKSNLELGEKFETLSDIQHKYSDELNLIMSEYVTNKRFTDVITRTSTEIKQTSEEIKLEVEGLYESFKGFQGETKAELQLKVGRDEKDHVVSMINGAADIINLQGKRIKIKSSKFELTEDGDVACSSVDISTTSGNRTVKISNGDIYINGEYHASGLAYVCKILSFAGYDGATWELWAYFTIEDNDPDTMAFDKFYVRKSDTSSYPKNAYATIINHTGDTVYIGDYIIYPYATKTILAKISTSAFNSTAPTYTVKNTEAADISLFSEDGFPQYTIEAGTSVNKSFSPTTYRIHEGAVTGTYPRYEYATIVNESEKTIYFTSMPIAGGETREVIATVHSSSTESHSYLYAVGTATGTETLYIVRDGEKAYTVTDKDSVGVLLMANKTYTVTDVDPTTYPQYKYATIVNNTEETVYIGNYTIAGGATVNIIALALTSETTSNSLEYDISIAGIQTVRFYHNDIELYSIGDGETVTGVTFSAKEAYYIEY